MNRLADEASPYLRQHRHNPVDWYPWGDAAFARARELDRPIFLSIGYSACHWCHVMAEESFEDPAMARYLNEHFVCIKVDREERPDVDEIYMGALQAMGQPGGWPLSAWLTPDGKPFFGGTYYPPEDRHGRPSFRRVSEAMVKAWQGDREQLLQGADKFGEQLREVLATSFEPGEPTIELLARVVPQARERFDEQHKGFASPPAYRPKFPHATELQSLLRLDDAAGHEMALATLHAMRRGGLCDQLGGGFHRYSTDRRWLVPHFEKMLYDNALLGACYLEGYQLDGDERLAATARQTLDYLLREMAAPGGGFWSSTDAQSEGEEGRYFVWSKAEVDALLGARSAAFCAAFDVSEAGNWDGHNVLWRKQDVGDFAAERATLLAARQQRVPPATDDKLLASWNALVLEALCRGYRVLGDERYRVAAQRTGAFLLERLVQEGRVRRVFQAGRARLAGTLDDHAAVADAMLSLFEIDGEPRWLRAGRTLLGTLDRHFSSDDGGFWSTADDGEQLLARVRSATEGSTPPGAAVATRALLRAGLLCADEALYERGVRSLRAHHGLLAERPAAASSLVLALQFHLADPREVVVVGAPDDERTIALLQAAWRAYPVRAVVTHIHDGNRAELDDLTPIGRGKVAGADGAPRAYVCRRGACEAPVESAVALAASLAR